MTDRERIAEAIKSVHVPGYTLAYRDMADAVLAALGDRLLPEVPEWVVQKIVTHTEDTFGTEYVEVELFGDEDDQYVQATGITEAAAIRSALESQP